MENLEKIRKIKEVFNSLDVNFAREMEENVDLQYFVLKNLKKSIKSDEIFIKLILINSLVSYQLGTTGELWWKEFSDYWSKHDFEPSNLLKEYIKFLRGSKGNKRLLDTKTKRIEKIFPFLNGLTIQNFEDYYQNMEYLLLKISKELNSKKESKTIVFAVKMFGYAGRIVFNKFIPYPMEIQIPKDSRIENYTKKLTDEDPVVFWGKISKESNIPPLHLDSIIWPALGRNFDNKSLLNTFGKKSELVFKLVDI
ncbi:DNA-(apurinic or apyrimidinic site) lyase [Methanococcus vannielii SB]|uniref:N-glycosylase/DNA lyase n=1 Tax=Methanococcus vannielii (strain ATCC 35089 / DSM 1224 / JCM 13029 / OCM 148 / SB) TaxID=406327 RepID=A6URT9_METVS|nr:N-glycosylase/DNA lyase [Methanococcus vannielii]ABR55211.1 DNA-(apurinic or apyrimidinic site) lyase [Methanococcus vannielii SB]